jgi:chorismate synthase
VIDFDKGTEMLSDIRAAAEGGESLGGIVECAAVNVPAGIGSPIFDGIENSIAQLLFGIPGVRGVEFGAGFRTAEMVGSQSNDEFYVDDHGYLRTLTNHHGGILGGISSGMPIIVRAAFKPTPTLRSVKETGKLMESEKLEAEISAECCIVPRMVPCVEAAVNIALLSHMLDYPHFNS